MPSPDMTIADYYRRPAVRQRIEQYCGGCLRVMAMRPGQGIPMWETAVAHPREELDELLASGGDLARSLWDAEHLLFHLDIDYHNVDVPAEPFTHPLEVFFKLEPVYRATMHVLMRFGIAPLVLMTGRGYHFTGQVPLDSLIVDRLASLAPHTPTWHEPEMMEDWHARAYSGIGLIVEHLSHLIVKQATRHTRIPIVFNGTDVGAGAGANGRECVSLDFSYAGDPLTTRYIRVAFGTYQLHRFRPDIFGAHAAALPPLIAVPRSNEPLDRLLIEARTPAIAARLAAHADTHLPLITEGLDALITHYLASPLAAFHQRFYATLPHPPQMWADSYDRVDTRILPPCVAWPLHEPNDLLLQPARLQHLTRGLIAHNWHPRHIAGLVHSRYRQDHHWGPRWSRLDPQTRAEFDIRVFAGMLATGLDRGVDYNCVSAQEKGLCPFAADCHRDLTRDHPRIFKGRAS
jgi:hypothetical protein